MKLNAVLLTCIVLAFATVAFAQESDPISGAWTGEMGASDSDRARIKMELKFDGKSFLGTVVGLPKPGEIKSGTYDPKTGAFEFEASPTGDTTTRLSFAGTLVNGTATGRVKGDNRVGTFIVTKSSGGASQGGPNDSTEALRKGFEEVSDWVTKAADQVPADKYSYKPVPTVRSFGEIIAHVADSYLYYCGRGAGNKVEWSDAIEKGSTDKATLVAKLKQSLDTCKPVYSSPAQWGPLMANVAHTNLHYGNIVTYMRMLGVKPPSS